MTDLSEKCTVHDVDSDVYSALEVILMLPFVFLAMVGVVAIGAGLLASGELDDVLVAPIGGLIVGTVAILAAGNLAGPVFVLSDSRDVGEADTAWTPAGGLYAVGTFLFGYLGLLLYMRKRHRYVIDRIDEDGWWRFVAAGTVGLPVLVGLAWLVVGAARNVQPTVVLVGLATVLAAVLPVAAYRDAIYVRLHATEWQPNPATYPAIGFCVTWLYWPVFVATEGWPLTAYVHPAIVPWLPLAVVLGLAGGIYLLRRRATVGLD